MTKVVINKCFGGFCLSAEAVEALAARRGHPQVWWFKIRFLRGRDLMKPITDGSQDGSYDYAYTIPNPTIDSIDAWIDPRPEGSDRSDADLVAVVEELGDRASGGPSSLRIVEIPDGVDWLIEEYDGKEWVAEAHRTWG